MKSFVYIIQIQDPKPMIFKKKNNWQVGIIFGLEYLKKWILYVSYVTQKEEI